MDWTTVIAAAVTALCALFGTYLSNKRQSALMEYRLMQLERKVDKHNNVIERTYRLEGEVKELQNNMKEIKKGA